MFSIKRDGEEKRVLKYEDKNCVGCGICSDVCPSSSLRLGQLVPIARGLIEMDLVSVKESSCVFCGLCATACPFDALSLYVDDVNIKDIDYYPIWKKDAIVGDEDCVYCKKCYEACPTDSIIFERNLPNPVDLVRGEIEIYKDKCIYCGFCAELCPVEAITVKNIPTSTVDKLNNSIEVDLSKCVFCGICKRVCPENAIKQVCSTCMLKEEIKVPEITGNVMIFEDSCVYCSWCSEVCPNDVIDIRKPFDGNLELVETDDKLCKGGSCHACLDVCACNAVSIVDGKSFTDLTFCNLCGACVRACPQDIRILTRTDVKLENINSEAWDEILSSQLVGK